MLDATDAGTAEKIFKSMEDALISTSLPPEPLSILYYLKFHWILRGL